jgi:predicted Fe-Mo cluster-binding NifX family protein
MELEQDLTSTRRKQTSGLGPKKNLAKKPMLIGLAIIIILILILVLPIFNQENVDNNLLNDTIDFSCGRKADLNISEVVAFFADGNTKTALTSDNGTETKYIQIYENKVLLEVIENQYKDSANRELEIINLLKEKNVSGVSFAKAKETFIKQIGEAGMKCYLLGETVDSYVGRDPVIDPSFCKLLTDQNLVGKIAFGSDDNTVFSLTSDKKEKANYLIIYENLNHTKIIENTAKDSNNSEEDFIKLLKAEGIETIMLAKFGESLEKKLRTTGVSCYEAGEEIQNTINKQK